MSVQRLACTAPLILLLACGGGGKSSSGPTSPAPPITPLTWESAEAVTTAFLLAEHQQFSAPALPSLEPLGDSGVFGLKTPGPIPDCVTLTLNGTASVLLTFNGCVGPNGGTLSGKLLVSWKPNEYTLVYQDLQATKGTKGWLLNGTRTLQTNPAAKQALVTVAGMTIGITDSANEAVSRTVKYASSLTTDWATPGAYKLWGSFSAQSGSDPALACTISAGAPLLWNPGCCYPVAGVMSLQQGPAKADLTFTLPCGTVTVAPFGQAATTRNLTACP
jgi:hypothetical protein